MSDIAHNRNVEFENNSDNDIPTDIEETYQEAITAFKKRLRESFNHEKSDLQIAEETMKEKRKVVLNAIMNDKDFKGSAVELLTEKQYSSVVISKDNIEKHASTLAGIAEIYKKIEITSEESLINFPFRGGFFTIRSLPEIIDVIAHHGTKYVAILKDNMPVSFFAYTTQWPLDLLKIMSSNEFEYVHEVHSERTLKSIHSNSCVYLEELGTTDSKVTFHTLFEALLHMHNTGSKYGITEIYQVIVDNESIYNSASQKLLGLTLSEPIGHIKKPMEKKVQIQSASASSDVLTKTVKIIRHFLSFDTKRALDATKKVIIANNTDLYSS